MKRIITAALCGFVFGASSLYGHVSAETLGMLAKATVGAMKARAVAVQEIRHAWH